MPSASVPLVVASSVIEPVSGLQVACYWCRRLLNLCDGRRTLEEVAGRLDLPVSICLSLGQKSLEHGWALLRVISADVEQQLMQEVLWTELLNRTQQVIGLGSEKLLCSAAACAGQPCGAVLPAQFAQLERALLALVSGKQRPALTGHLEAVRHKYAILAPLRVA